MKHSWKRIFALILAVVMTLSLLPTAALAALRKSSRAGGATIDVTEYGADPTGTKESSTAVIAALEYAATLDENEQKTIVFPKGEYHFYEDYSETRELYASNTLRWDERSYANKHIGILVEGMKNVTVDGGGSLFIYHGNVCTMAAIDSENVTFTNFSEDFASPEVVDVTVEAHEGNNAAILFIPACYNFTISGTNINWQGEISPVTGQPYWSGNNGFLSYRQYLDTVTGRSSSSGTYPFDNVSSITKVDDTHIKVVYSNAASRPPVGQCCQMRHPNPRKTPGVFFLNSKDITLSNANFHFLHGFGMVGQLSTNITLDTVKCQARPGTGRTSAGFADFVQMSSIAGKVTVRNCEFADPHDDPINIHGTFLEVKEITADRRRVVVRYMHNETWGFPQYNVGDTVDFSVKDTLASTGITRTVTGVVNPGEGLWLDGTQRSKNNENDMRTIIVELDEPIPDTITANSYVMENVTHTPEVLIENCRFTETPTRGILVTTRKPVVIRNNYFDRICSSSIFISCDGQDWRESGHAEDVLITGNTFIAENITGLNDHYGGTGIIMIWPTNPSDDPNYQIHRNIRIEDNVFSLLPMGGAKRTIVAKSVNGLTVKNNLFQRYTPNMELELAADSTALTAGGTQGTALTSNGTTLTNRLFRLQACKQVVFEGNTYDDGLNLGVQLDGNVVTAADVTDKDGVLTVGGDNQLPAVGTVRYFSSDPAVATVDENGVVTGVSAGTAEIYAYRVAGARTFESNHLTFTVTGTAAAKPNKIDITSDKDAVDVSGTATLTAAVDPSDAGSVAWSVKPATDGAAATITSGGVLTATAPGVVEVTASLGGVTGSKLITVNKPSFVYLSDLNWTSATTGDSWSSVPLKDRSWESEKDGNPVRPIKLTGASNEEVTFEKGIGTHAASTITYDLAGLGYTRFTAKVGVSYYKHDSNEPHLYFVINGDGSQKFASSEMLGSTPYQEVDVDITGVNTLELKLTQPNNVWSAHGNWADAKLLCENAAPTISGVAVTSASPLAVNYTYSDADNDAETDSVIAWYVSDTQNGHYTRLENASSNTLTVTAATSEKWVKAVVVPRDATGRYGAPVTSAAVQAPAQPVVQSDATLATLSVSGLPLTPAFDPEVTEYTVSVPASATKVTLAATATQGNAATVAGTGEVTLTGTETAANVTVTAPNGTTTKTYTVTVRRAASSDATLSGLTASAGSAAITYNAATRFYELVADQTAQNLTFSATKADANAKIEVRYNAEEKGEYEGQTVLPLTAGLNNLELRVTAADGVSTALYRVRVMKPASTEAELTALTVNSGNVTVGDDTDLGLVPVTGNTATLNATVSDGATVYLSVDGKAVENNTSVTLAKTLSIATIRVVAEDGATENVYTLALSKNDPGNADLYLLKLEGMTLSPAFDKDTLTYTATFTDAQGTSALTAAATQLGADVTCETVSIYETAKGRVARDCHFFRDVEENFVKITVTSPNGETTKEYIINVTYEPVVYLSDLQWTSHTSGWSEGWANPGRDIGVENNPMTLWNGSGWETFEKGLGTHANSNTNFNISGLGFARFTAKVGPNKNSGSPHISFEVQGDGVTLWSSNGEITHSDPYQTVDIDVTGVSTLKIIDNQSGGNGAAHATWADAKFYGGNIGPALAETDVPVKYIEFEHETHTIYVNGTNDDHPTSVELHPTFKPVGVADSAHEMVLDWDSTDDSVATVNDGVVTAVAVGETEISATALSGATDTCTITVKKVVDGVLSVNGALKFGSRLTANLNEFDTDVRSNVTYTWYRGAGTSGTVLSNTNTYTPVKEDIGSRLTLKISAVEDSYYEGEVTFTTGTIAKADGHKVVDANLSHVNCTAEDSNDGQIVGLLVDHVYQYQKQNDDETWPEDEASWIDVDANSTSITGLVPGNYRIRHVGDDTRLPGEPSNTVTITVVGGTEVALTIPARFEGGTVRANRSQIPVGDTVVLTVTPDEGYELATLEATYTDENGEEQTLTVTERSDGKYTFLMPAFPADVDATFQLKTYVISHEMTNIICSLGDEENHTATHGEEFTVTLEPEEGYNMPRSLTVTETDTGKKFTDFTYEVDATDPAKRVMTFANGVTCNISVSGAATLKTYTVVYELTNGLRTASGAPQTATHSKELSVTLTAARGYALPEEITVTVAGEELTEGYTYDAETGAVTIENVTGNVVITAQGEAQDVPLQTATLVGPARVGRTLTVNVVPALATVEYQWILVDEDGTETDIDGATQASYVIPETAEGKTIKVRVTGTGSYDGELTTAPSNTILAASEPFVNVTGIELEPQETEVAVGKKVTLTATVTPDNATAPALAWSSDNEAIAKVDQNGVVTGVAEGTATITAASTDTVNNVTATCQVTVTKADTPNRPSSSNTSSSTTTTTTETREDGSKVTTVTKPDGTVTETVAQPDGTKTEAVTTKDGDVTITVTDPDGEELVKTEIPATIPEPEDKFVDIDQTPWAEEAINNVAGLKLVNGIGGNKYDPTTPMTRGALATVLHRLSNGKTDYKAAFKDVLANRYYTEGVAWAAKAKVVTGYTTDIFAPDDIITREQLAVMMVRYAKLIGMDTKADSKALDTFVDGEDTGSWAVDGVAWCVEKGILKGKGLNNLDPTANVSRAEVAVMLDRFIALIQK